MPYPGFTYWWAYSRSAPKYTREQRTVWDLSDAERQQLGSLLQSYISEDLINEHAAAGITKRGELFGKGNFRSLRVFRHIRRQGAL